MHFCSIIKTLPILLKMGHLTHKKLEHLEMKELKNYLTINSIFSATSGLIMLLFSRKLNELFNIQNESVFHFIGVNLILFSVFVGFVSSKYLTNRILVLTISILDTLWVLGSFTIIVFRLFALSTIGYAIMSVVAIWVAFLAYKQFKNIK